MNDKPDGRYPGTIQHAYVAEDNWNAGEYVLKLDVDLEGGGAVTCRQALSADDKKSESKRDSVLRELGLSLPLKSADLAALRTKSIDVNLKTSPKGRQNAYISTPMEERILSPEEVDALARADDDDIPF